jgi:CubicO group peptidase (beta-lactamase class C family)
VNEGHLTDLLGQHASTGSVPGAAIGILQDGVVTTACYGLADVSTGEPVTTETLFSIGSMTKSMVATVIARLAEAGRLALDDSVAAHVPELHGTGWARGATLRDLLANRSGVPLRAGLEFDFAGREQDDDEGALSRLVEDVAAAAPAATSWWSYTNVGWCVLGRVIEIETDAPWDDAMRHHLAEAGLNETSFAADAVGNRRASGHEDTEGGPVPVAPLRARAYGPAGATAVSTVPGLLRFAAMHLDDPSLAALRAVHAEVAICGWLDAWCLGWARFDWAGGRAWGWDGLINGERCVLRILPERKAAVVLLTNGSTGRALYRSLFAELMVSSFGVGVPPPPLDPSPGAAGDLSRFEGVYAWPDWRIEVTATESGLLISSEDGETEAAPLDERAFLVDALDPDNSTVSFGAFDASGRPGVLYQMLWGLPRLDE